MGLLMCGLESCCPIGTWYLVAPGCSTETEQGPQSLHRKGEGLTLGSCAVRCMVEFYTPSQTH